MAEVSYTRIMHYLTLYINQKEKISQIFAFCQTNWFFRSFLLSIFPPILPYVYFFFWGSKLFLISMLMLLYKTKICMAIKWRFLSKKFDKADQSSSRRKSHIPSTSVLRSSVAAFTVWACPWEKSNIKYLSSFNIRGFILLFQKLGKLIFLGRKITKIV